MDVEKIIKGLSPAMRRQILGEPPRNRSEAGGRTGTIDALRRRGLIKERGHELTPLGELVATQIHGR